MYFTNRRLARILIGLAAVLPAIAADPPRIHGRAPAPLIDSTALATSTTPSRWSPGTKVSWQWQLSTPVDQSVNAQVYDIDMFDNTATVVAQLHAKGRKVVCYVDVGTWEDWRPDAASFPAIVKGATNGWPGERWLDIRRLDLLGPILQHRFDLCKAKGFDAIEPDNVDGYSNSSGFPLSYAEQLTFNKWVANQAHIRGLSVALKNDLDQIPDLLSSFDFILDEQCFLYQECPALLPFATAGKAIFEVEYGSQSSPGFCPAANGMNFNAMEKHPALDVYRVPCR